MYFGNLEMGCSVCQDRAKIYDFMKLEELMRSLTCGDLEILHVVIWLVLTSVETEEISYLIVGSCVCWTCLREWRRSFKLHILFRELLSGSSNTEKWGDPQKKKFFISDSVEALIQFIKEHHASLKLHVHLRGGGEEKKELSLKQKNSVWGWFSEPVEI